MNAGRVVAIDCGSDGTAVLALARADPPVPGPESSLRDLETANSAANGGAHPEVLVLHKADVPALREEMRRAGAAWRRVFRGGGSHGFTGPAADGVTLQVARHEEAEPGFPGIRPCYPRFPVTLAKAAAAAPLTV